MLSMIVFEDHTDFTARNYAGAFVSNRVVNFVVLFYISLFWTLVGNFRLCLLFLREMVVDVKSAQRTIATRGSVVFQSG